MISFDIAAYGCVQARSAHRYLLVSSQHAMFLDCVLISAKTLVNGSTITQERGLERVDYFHIELGSHDVLLAEGAPSESFLEDGNRGQFHNRARRAVSGRACAG